MFMPCAARAVSIVEFGTRCFDGDTLGSFIEVTGNPLESTRNGMRLRAFDRNGAIMFDTDLYGGRGSQVFTFQEGGRNFLLATAPLIEQIGFSWGGPPLGYADNVLPFAFDPVAGRIQLYLPLNGGVQIASQVAYGTGLQVPAPPAGMSTISRSGVWGVEPHPVLDSFFHSVPNTGRPAPPCLTSPEYHVSGVRLQCEDGDTRGQYVEIEALGPTGNLGESVQLVVLDHRGVVIGTLAEAFSRDPSSPAFANRHWLLCGPAFEPAGPDTADARLPFVLDPAGGALQLVVNAGGLSWATDRFAYGTPAVPLPLPGKSYVRPLGSSVTTAVITPRNSGLAPVVVPQCAAGSGIGHPVVQELALACTDGLPQGQFLELSTRGSSLPMSEPYLLRHYRRDGSLAFELADVFAGIPVAALERDRSWLLVPAGDPRAAFADRALPDTLDREAGALELWRPGLAGDSLALRFEWGAAPLARPPDGGSLEAGTAVARLVAYPSPAAFAGNVLSHDDCTADADVIPVPVRRTSIECADGSRSAAFVELDGLTPALVRDTRLGMRWLASNGAELARVEPLFPARASWDLTGSPHWLIAMPGFEARTGLVPDVAANTALAETPASLQFYRRDPLTNTLAPMNAHLLQSTLLGPGRAEVREPSGQYEAGAVVSPQRFDGARAASGTCWRLPHPEAVRLAAVLLRCRTGGTGAQYVQLSSADDESMYSPDLLLRVRDHAGLEITALRAPFPAGFAERTWPAGRALLVGGPEFAATFGVAPDATLPAALDTLGGRLELVLARAGLPEIPLDALDYGSGAVTLPPPGAALVADGGTWRVESLPSAKGIAFELPAPTACLGECPGRTVRFAVGGDQAITAKSGRLTDVETDFRFDGARGSFELSSGFGELAVRWDDRYVVEGPPPGSSVTLTVRVHNRLTSPDTCLVQPPICYHGLASVMLEHAGVRDSIAAALTARPLEVPLTVTAGEAFSLLLSLRARPAPLSKQSATTHARLEFVGLPVGARVRSCSGFDSQAQRGAGAPVVQAGPHRIEVQWPVSGDANEQWQVERRVDDGDWQPFETRAADPGGRLRIVDTRVVPGHEYAYRTLWSDEYGSYVSATPAASAPRAPGYALEGAVPNPSTGAFRVGFEIPEAGSVSLELLDLAGRVLRSRTRTFAAGRYQEPLAGAGGLAPGVYTVRMRYRGLTSWQRVVVLR